MHPSTLQVRFHHKKGEGQGDGSGREYTVLKNSQLGLNSNPKITNLTLKGAGHVRFDVERLCLRGRHPRRMLGNCRKAGKSNLREYLFLMDVRMGPATRSQILFLKIPPAEVQATTITKEKTTKRGMSSDITLSANNATLGSPFQLASGSRRAHLSHRYRRSRRFEPYKREYALSQCSPLENMRQSTTILRRRNHGNVDQVVHQWDLSAASPQTQDSVSMSDLTAAVAGVSLAEEIAAASAASPQTQDSVSMSDLTAAVAGVSLAEEIAAALGGVSIATQLSSSHSPQSPGSHSRSDFERDPHAAVALMVSFGSTFVLLLFQATEESW
ncbi:hypothetical protein DFH07DRAFT_766213 [Mycena maculata]|uniref:Uncharacterized protein n=1 Tax=Mycena maculata TaxID=230809 RepID=A0AAD7NWD9_9AGAR|nr:hypothetical protein DFH07DRAFT_766213 [Mycena maculata]